MWDSFLMPKNTGRKKAKSGIPKHGRSEKDVMQEMGLQNYAANVPLGNTDPTVVYGVMYGDMPNRSRIAKGGLRQFRGKYS